MSRLPVLVCVLLVAGPLVGGATAADPASPPADTTFVHEGESITVNATAGAVVAGTTDLPPGTEVSVRLQSSGSASPFLLADSTTVDRDGRFRSVVDLSAVSPGSEFEAVVHYNGTTVAETTGTVVACDGCRAAAETTRVTSTDPAPAGPGVAIEGRAAVAPGTDLTVRVRSTGGTALLVSETATVGRDGRFRAVVDLSDADPNSTLSVAVRRDGGVLTETTRTVAACEDCRQTATADETGVPDTVELLAGTEPGLPVTLADASEARIVIGDASVNYRVNGTVTDENGDGRVRVAVNRTAAGTPDEGVPTLSARGDSDTVTVTDETALPAGQDGLDAGAYPVRLFVDGAVVDTGTLVLPATDADRRTETTPVAEFGLDGNVLTTRRGQVFGVAMTLGDADAATLRFGGPSENYTAVVTARDANDDGRVRLLFDTTAVAEGDAWRAAGDDEATVRRTNASAVDSSRRGLPAGDYSLALHRGATVTDGPADIGTLVVQPSPASETTNDPATDESLPVTALAALGGGGLLALLALVAIVGGVRD
ncbi:BGTF surface domain-containing protein [Salinirubrum litoreum]|uniref:BGTF surface domain-containing protein n=1 Tax=Salinirubrum litoreum TaxID=1126234 RepID=A0ABD5RCY1_9EURY|nr:BGTF surface domain-containing protein [Salinirubrum litoreum]